MIMLLKVEKVVKIIHGFYLLTLYRQYMLYI